MNKKPNLKLMSKQDIDKERIKSYNYIDMSEKVMKLKLNKKVTGHQYDGSYGQYEIKIERGMSKNETYWFPYIKVGGHWKLISYYPTLKQAKEIIKKRIDNDGK